ncbi:unnamed protein product [Caenorhabditis sp. 36 PRJEB53466]|nr:unnamed protein product [Caenorhabditis sp. 36 PRJEB53466]
MKISTAKWEMAERILRILAAFALCLSLIVQTAQAAFSEYGVDSEWNMESNHQRSLGGMDVVGQEQVYKSWKKDFWIEESRPEIGKAAEFLLGHLGLDDDGHVNITVYMTFLLVACPTSSTRRQFALSVENKTRARLVLARMCESSHQSILRHFCTERPCATIGFDGWKWWTNDSIVRVKAVAGCSSESSGLKSLFFQTNCTSDLTAFAYFLIVTAIFLMPVFHFLALFKLRNRLDSQDLYPYINEYGQQVRSERVERFGSTVVTDVASVESGQESEPQLPVPAVSKAIQTPVPNKWSRIYRKNEKSNHNAECSDGDELDHDRSSNRSLKLNADREETKSFKVVMPPRSTVAVYKSTLENLWSRVLPQSEVLVRRDGIIVERQDFMSLSGSQLLTDAVLDLYFALITARSSRSGFVSASRLPCFFFEAFINQKAVARTNFVNEWVDKRSAQTNLLFIPIHDNEHWTLFIVNRVEKTISYYDSVRGNSKEKLVEAKELIELTNALHTTSKVDWIEWIFFSVHDGPQQTNATDCGVFIAQYAECVSRGVKPTFGQNDMIHFRTMMALEICQQQLFLRK